MGGDLDVVRDGGTFVRARLVLPASQLELDIAHEPSTPLAKREVVDGVTVDALEDLRANKLTCLLSRSEPRDLVDLYFLDQAGFAPESSLEDALSKDAGIDPGILSFLLQGFPTHPMPVMLRSLDEAQLRSFKVQLADRFRVVALPAEE